MESDFSPSIELKGSVTPLESGRGFLFEVGGHSVVALKLPGKIAEQLSGDDLKTSGFISRLKAKLGFNRETERWFTVTSVDNPLLEQIDSYSALIAERLSRVTGNTITKSELAVSATVPIERIEEDQPTQITERVQSVVSQQSNSN